jgi:hypothetical protein
MKKGFISATMFDYVTPGMAIGDEIPSAGAM